MTFVACLKCCLESHKYLPFHRIQVWKGKFFQVTSLYAQGHVLHLGHGGKPCPHNHSATFDVNQDVYVEGLDLNWEDQEDNHAAGVEDEEVEERVMEDVLVTVHTTEVFQQHVRWCTCPAWVPRETYTTPQDASILLQP